MFSVWTLSSLILSYTLSFPVHNNSSYGSHMEDFLNVTERNSTEFNQTRDNLHQDLYPIKVIRYICPLPTCSLSNLGSSLQIGDEIAGDLVKDPMGIGKK